MLDVAGFPRQPVTVQTMTFEDRPAAQAPEKRDPLFIEAVARAFRVLETFSASPRPASLRELAQAAGIDKSGAQRLAHTLVQLGYLENARGGLLPGRRLLERSFDYLRSHKLIERATPVLVEVRRTAQERVDLSLFDDLTMLYAIRLQAKRETFFTNLVGRRIPTFCSSGGHAVMSRLEEAQVADILARSPMEKATPQTTTDPATLLERVRAAREQGYALVANELLAGVVSVAAPVLGADGEPIAAVHIAGQVGEWPPEEFGRRFGPLAAEAAQALHET